MHFFLLSPRGNWLFGGGVGIVCVCVCGGLNVSGCFAKICGVIDWHGAFVLAMAERMFSWLRGINWTSFPS